MRTEESQNSRDPGQAASHWWLPVWVLLVVLLGASVAVLMDAILFGRIPLDEVVRGWLHSLTLMLITSGVIGWWVAYFALLRSKVGRIHVAHAIIPASPLILGAVLPLLLIYVSDQINNYFYFSFVYLNQPKALALLFVFIISSMLLQLVMLQSGNKSSLGQAYSMTLARWREILILAILAVLGAFQVSAYLDRPFDDFLLRYWPIADAIWSHAPYPVAVVAGLWQPFFVAGGLSKYLIDLPFYPGLIAASFGVFGHNVVAVYIPTVLSNVLLPGAIYLLFREVVGYRVVALSATCLLVLFPPLRFYVLNWTIPDSTFFLVLALCCWLFVRLVKGDQRMRTWVLFGLLGAVVTLTRPEGAAYAGIYLLVALPLRVAPGRKAAAIIMFAIPVAAFSLVMMTTFGMPWPRNWVGALGLQNVMANWQVLAGVPIPTLANQMRLSAGQLLGWVAFLVVVSAVGSMPLFYQHWKLSLLYLPAWINVVSVLLVDPRVSGARLWPDFFRHVSYPLPLLVLAAAAAVVGGLSLLKRQMLRSAGLLTLNLLLFGAVLWNVHLLSKPSLNFGDDAGNLLGGGRFNLVDIMGTQPLHLPVFGFERVDGYWVVTAWGNSLWGYPDYLANFFSRFDAVRHTTGTAYQSASLYLYLTALVLVLLPSHASLQESRSMFRRLISWIGQAHKMGRPSETGTSQ